MANGPPPPIPSQLGYYTYLLQCADGTYYTGWTTQLNKRVSVHNAGKGAKYTRGRLPVQLVQYWCFETRSEAMRFEHWLKQLPRPEKERLIQSKT